MGISSYFTLSDDQLGMLEKKARSSAACGQLAFDGTEVLALIETIRLLRDSVAHEREECAKLADDDGYGCDEKASFCEAGEYGCHSRIARKIRARGK